MLSPESLLRNRFMLFVDSTSEPLIGFGTDTYAQRRECGPSNQSGCPEGPWNDRSRSASRILADSFRLALTDYPEHVRPALPVGFAEVDSASRRRVNLWPDVSVALRATKGWQLRSEF